MRRLRLDGSMSTMPSPAIDVSAGFLAGVIRRVRLWVAERVFVVGPAVWYGLVIASAAFAAVVGVVTGSLWLAAALGACAVLAVAPARVSIGQGGNEIERLRGDP